MKFLKEVFSAKNIKLVMLMGALANPYITTGSYLDISESIRNIKEEEEEVQQRKAA